MPHKVLPVFSNVGELDTVDGRRQDTLVVFGSTEVRSKVYAWANGQVFDYAKRSQLQIHDIGPTIGDVSLQARLSEEGVAVRGKLSADEVSAAAARLGAVAYPVEFVAESGVFAAYCAHGICPILLSSSYATHDGLVANKHFLAGFNALAGDSRARVVGSNARACNFRDWHGYFFVAAIGRAGEAEGNREPVSKSLFQDPLARTSERAGAAQPDVHRRPNGLGRRRRPSRVRRGLENVPQPLREDAHAR
ncbi:hypothetical protein [Variovorax sp. J22R115]|uniref:hypothetical protein n=1 Tax=Variovorax sp. J22R115 TaxID=3053509 RepID=UPI002576D78A|nr:hypothetical protein [Variovorax sp. J22R115]MDM0052555.1 hypothetical protein [Variovorax sp. J22R115]